jgi:hypothetical protein
LGSNLGGPPPKDRQYIYHTQLTGLPKRNRQFPHPQSHNQTGLPFILPFSCGFRAWLAFCAAIYHDPPALGQQDILANQKRLAKVELALKNNQQKIIILQKHIFLVLLCMVD